MTEEARSITAEHLDVRLPLPGPDDELGRLAATFNELFARLERSFEQMRRFTADASHELRTPLTVIRSVGEVGLREPQDEAGYREIIGTMLEEADRLALLTSTLLELTRAEGGRGPLRREAIDLGESAREAAEFLGALAEEKEVGLALDLPAAAPTVLGDRTVLHQALVNVLDNALKHSPAGTTVTVAVRTNGDRAEVSVADQGPGIAPEHREHVFERFYRADPSRNSKTGGFGLGLAIARWAVEAHGGRIELESEPGRGSVFRIRLPLSQAPDGRQGQS
jgi:heavy metal sensor kinase